MKKGINQEKVLAAALQAADERGLSNLTLKEIADKLAVKTPSLYNYVRSLDEVYDLLARKGLKLLIEKITQAVLGLSGEEALWSIAHSYQQFAADHSALYESIQKPKVWKSEESQQLAADLIAIFLKVLTPFGFSREKNIHIIRILRSYLHGFATLDFEMKLDVEKSFDLGLSLIIGGIKGL